MKVCHEGISRQVDWLIVQSDACQKAAAETLKKSLFSNNPKLQEEFCGQVEQFLNFRIQASKLVDLDQCLRN